MMNENAHGGAPFYDHSFVRISLFLHFHSCESGLDPIELWYSHDGTAHFGGGVSAGWILC